jgi:hypothetical protein
VVPDRCCNPRKHFRLCDRQHDSGGHTAGERAMISPARSEFDSSPAIGYCRAVRSYIGSSMAIGWVSNSQDTYQACRRADLLTLENFDRFIMAGTATALPISGLFGALDAKWLYIAVRLPVLGVLNLKPRSSREERQADKVLSIVHGCFCSRVRALRRCSKHGCSDHWPRHCWHRSKWSDPRHAQKAPLK